MWTRRVGHADEHVQAIERPHDLAAEVGHRRAGRDARASAQSFELFQVRVSDAPRAWRSRRRSREFSMACLLHADQDGDFAASRHRRSPPRSGRHGQLRAPHDFVDRMDETNGVIERSSSTAATSSEPTR